MLAIVLILALPALGQVTQEQEQEGESADLDQSFEVSGSGDNSNQCANIQGVGNTGNAQNLLPIIQYSGEADDFEFEEVGSDITLTPNEDVDEVFVCDTQVNQAASASG